MKIVKSIRTAFSSACRKICSNDNTPIHFTPSREQQERALNPPTDNSVVETLHGRKVSDPFRPLEKLTAPETAEWIARQNKKFEDFVTAASDVKANTISFFDDSRSKEMRETMPAKYGDKYVVWRMRKGDSRMSLHIKDVPDYGAPARVLLDPMIIDPSGKTDIASTSITRDGKTLAYALSVAGSDETTLKFMDVETGKDTGLVYTKFRSSVKWDRDGQGFHYTRHVDESSKSYEVCHHKMGTPVENDKVIYTPDAPETHVRYFRLLKDSKDESGSHEWISYSDTRPGKNSLLVRPIGSDEKFNEIFPLKEGTLQPIHEIGGKIYARTSLGSPNERLIRFDINDPSPGRWQTVLPENNKDMLKDAFVWQNMIFATYRHDTGEVLKVFDLAGKHLHDAPIPPLSTFSIGSFRIEDDKCLISYDNFQEEGGVYEYDATTNEISLHKKSTTPIDLKDCIVERTSAVSKDGTEVPMTVIRNPDTKLDGTAATILYGYGGFDYALEPSFSSSIAQWVRSGGIYVQANLRGGGEYGQEWYDAGRKENKQNVFDDFIACAEHLVKNGYTSQKRLAIDGASNGGLLTLATALQRPDLFGAVISQVPVTDMFRFHIGSHYGYSWKSDYGDPDIKKDFNIAAKYSPLHNVKDGLKHPPILITTDANDDRVLPWHSFKMAATLQSKESPESATFLNVKTGGGHGAGTTWNQWCKDIADIRAFLDRAIGPVNQNDYKAKLATEKKEKDGRKLVNRVIRKFKP